MVVMHSWRRSASVRFKRLTALVERGYRVIPQVGSQGFSIDMVVEGDGGRRLAIECDGDQYITAI
jgi:hypothetical protein